MREQISNPVMWVLALAFWSVLELGGLSRTIRYYVNTGAHFIALLCTGAVSIFALGWWCLLAFLVGFIIHFIRSVVFSLCFAQYLDLQSEDLPKHPAENYLTYWYSGLLCVVIWPILMTSAAFLIVSVNNPVEP